MIHNGCHYLFLPGVPSEMLAMLRGSVLPYLAERMPRRKVIRAVSLNLFGPCEAEIDELLTGLARPDHGLSLGICARFPYVQVSLRAESESADAVDALLEPAVNKAQHLLGSYVFSEGDIPLSHVVASLFREKGLSLALAESCTGGMLGALITDVAGSSGFFLQGVVCYDNQAKLRHVGVPSEVLAQYGAVSSECAAEMAKGIRSAAGSDLGIAVTGIAGPDGGSEEKPVGTVFISLAAPDGCWTKRFAFSGSRADVRIKTSWTALDWLRRYLDGRRS
jgi:nicotinamide-nucleotide amidase